MSVRSSDDGMSPEKRLVMDHFDHPNPNIVENIAGGWWRIWNGFYYHADEGYCLSRMSEGGTLVTVALLHSEPGYTGHVIALENTDYVLEWDFDDPDFDPNEADPQEGMYEWMIDWMYDHPEGITEAPEPPTCIHGSSLHDTFTRGPLDAQVEEKDDFICYVNQGGSNRSAYIRVTPERGDVLQAHYPASYNPKRERLPPRLDSDGWRRVLKRLE